MVDSILTNLKDAIKHKVIAMAIRIAVNAS
jgi:hypothetical protein